MKSCPDCRLFLSPLEWRNVQFMVCRSCGGCWADGAAAPTVLSGLLSDLGELDDLLPSHAAGPPIEGLALPCPDCSPRTLCATEAIPGRLPVARCETCGGIWLRAGERSELSGRPRAAGQSDTPIETPSTSDALPHLDTTVESEPPTCSVSVAVQAAPPVPAIERRPSTAEEALEALLAGNDRFARGASLAPNTAPTRRAEVMESQSPFAAVLSCSDSRVPPEIIFDRGIGDLFVVRVAGASLTASTRASLLYSVLHLHTPLVVVLGHTRCGAVRACIEEAGQDPLAEPLIKPIRAAVARARALPGDLADNASREHAIAVATTLRTTLSAAASKQSVDPPAVACMIYDIVSGRTEVVPIPEQEPAETEAPPVVDVVAPPQTPPPPESSLTPPGNIAESRFPRWCPKCRKGYDVATGFCTGCGVLLVEPWFRVRCQKCRKENLIGLDRCWSCRADLHPNSLQSKQPPRVRPANVGGSTGQTGCSTGVVVLLIAMACAAALLVGLGGG